MSRTGWKGAERKAAALINGKRYPASMGGPVDVESDGWCGQVKERRRLSLAQLETLALEITRIAETRRKAGVVIVKRSAGPGRPTPWLFIVTEQTWRAMNGAIPGEGA